MDWCRQDPSDDQIQKKGLLDAENRSGTQGGVNMCCC